MANSKGRHGQGTIVWVVNAAGDGCWYARYSVKGQGRQRKRLSTSDGRDLTDKRGDEALARKLAAELSKFYNAEAQKRERARFASRMTVEQFGELWTSGELYQRHGEVRGLRIKRSVRDDIYRLRAHVYPHLGSRAVAEVTEEDVERALAAATQAAEKKLGRPWRQASKFQVYQIMRRLFDLAVKPGRLRADNPVSVDLRPSEDERKKLFSFLYPLEVLALLACTDVPVERRMHYALAIYTGLRMGSLKALEWSSIDFSNNTIMSLESKTGLPQVFAQADPALPGLRSLMTLLKRWHELQGCPKHGRVVGKLGCRRGREAETLRADLKAAGVTRAVLFSTAANVEPLRFHDMRATFVTWARRAGKGSGWIGDRTGHITDEMMRRYDRGARQLADLQYEPFPDVSAMVPELATDLANVARLADFRRD